MKLSIVMPAYNEERRLPPVLRAYAAFFEERMGGDAEILLVANGSEDRTAEVAREIAEAFSGVRVLEEPEKIGKGGAVILGVKAARGEYVGFADADGATSPEEFFRLYEKARGGAGVVASRWMKGAEVSIPQKGLRLLSSRLFNGVVRLLLGLRYRDTQCGAKIFSAEAWKAILPEVGTTRYAFDVDVLFRLKRHGFRIAEEPTVWHDVEGSKVRVLNASIEMFLAVVRMRLVHSPLRFSVRWYDRILAKPVEFLLSDKLFRHTLLLSAATLATSVFNVAYQMVAGRALSPAEFALLATFLSAFAIFARPMGTVANALTRYVSLLVEQERPGDVRRLLGKWGAILGCASIVPALALAFYADSVAAFFHLNRTAPVRVSALAVPVLMMTPVLGGAIQGLQRFGWSALASIVGASGRLVFGALFLLAVYPACGWALAGHVGGLYLTLGVLGFGLWRALSGGASGGAARPLPSMRVYLFQSFVFQLAAGVLLSGDMIFVKHYLPESKEFAYAATLGRIVVFMTMSVATAMFPKVVSDEGFTPRHRRLYLRSQAYTLGFAGVALFFCLLFPSTLLRVLFHVRHPDAELLWLVRGMSLTMSVAAMLNTNLRLLLAQKRFVLLTSVVASCVAYGLLVRWFHRSAFDVVRIAFATNLLALTITTAGILRLTKKKKRAIR